MEWDFTDHEILGKLSQQRRGKLFAWMNDHMTQRMRIRTAGGTLPKTKKGDREPITLLAIDPEKKVMYTLADAPAGTEETLIVGELPFWALSEYVMGKIATPRRESTGRPPKYGERDAGQVCRMHDAGMSIRAIAKELGMATATVQKILKCNKI